MIAFEHPWALVLALPLWLLFSLFARAQRRALEWIQKQIDPRFRSSFSRYSSSGLRCHLIALFCMGLLLILATSGMHLRGSGEGSTDRGRLLLLVDASASMLAEDVAALGEGDEAPSNRFELARDIAQQIVAELETWEVGLVSFSGVTTLHLPLVNDRILLGDALRTLEFHSYYQNTGSSFAGALDAALHFVDPRQRDLQILLLSDGEMPREEDFSLPLEALASQGIPVHGLSLGSEEGEGRSIFDYRDVVAKKEEKTPLVSYHTRRDDRHLRRMAKSTGGYFGVASQSTLNALLEALHRRQKEQVAIEDPKARYALAPHLLGTFLLLFLFETLIWGHHRPTRGNVFDLQRLATKASIGPSSLLLVLAMPFVAFSDVSCRGPANKAHRENEIGIARDAAGQHSGARIHYERAAAFAVDREIPTFNQARSFTLSKEWSRSHDVYQEALELRPDLARAHYNDGMALYRWGEAERDPRGCHLERTQDLWKQSLRRFQSAGSLLKPESALAGDSAANHRAVSAALSDLSKLLRSPPEHCRQQGSGSDSAESEDSENSGDKTESDPASQGEPGDSESGDSRDTDANDDKSSSEYEQDQPPEESESEAQPDASSPEPNSERGTEAGGSLSPQELEEIRAELERIASQASEPGKYHRRTLPEQFGPEVWGNPDPEIWW